MQSSASTEVKIPSQLHSDAVSIKTHGNEKIGINVEGSAEKGFYVKGVEPDSVAEASGKIETGDQLTGITIDMNTLSLDEAQSLLKVLSPYPVKISVKKATHDESLNASATGEIGLNEQFSMIDSGIEIKGPKIDQTKFEIRGRKAKGGAGIDVALPDEEIKIKKFEHKSDPKRLDIDVQSPTGNITFPGTIKEASVHDPKTKGYLIKLPKFGDKGKIKADVDIEAKDMNIETSLKGEGVHIKSPKSGGININLPSFGLSGNDVTTAASVENANQNATASLERTAGAEIDVKDPKGKTGFHIAMPKFGIKSKTPKVDANVNVPERDIKLEGSMPQANLNIKQPSSGGININLPSFGITAKGAKVERGIEPEINKISPETEINVKTPEIESGIHIGLPNLPKVSLKGKGLKGDAGVDVDLPEADLNVSAEAPDVDIKAPKGSGGFHIGMPKFGIKGKGVKGDVDVNLPEADLNVDARLPDADSKLKGPKGSGGFNINLPSFGISGKGPQMEGELDADVKLPKGDIDVKAELPDVDIDVKAPKGKGGFHMPKFGFKGKVPKGEVDVNLPEGDLNVDASLPDADVNLKGPKGSGGFNINLPSFGVSGKGPKVEGGIDADVKLPKGDIDVKADLPDVDIDVKAPKAKGGFHMPKLGFKGTALKGEVDANLPEGDMSLAADVSDVDVDVNVPKGKSGFHMNLPSIPKLNIRGKGVSHGDVVVDVPSGDAVVSGNADIDVHVPKSFPKLHIDSRGNVDKSLGGSADIDAGVSLPKSDSDNLALSSKSKSKGFHIGLPKFAGKGKGVKSSGFSRAKSEGVDANITGKDYSIELPKFNLATSGLEARADISGSAAHGGASVSGSSPVHVSGRYQTGFPKITSKSQSFEPNLNVNMETSGAKVGSLPREIDSASRKGKFRVKARPRSMEIGASASESDHDLAGDDTGTPKKRKRRGFIQRIKDFFSTDSKSPSQEFERGSAPEHPDYHEKPNVSAVSITHDDPGLSIKPKSSVTEVAGDVPEASVSLSPPALSGGLQADLPSVSYSFSSSKTIIESKGPSHHQVTETKEIRIEKGGISSEFKSASETSHVQVEKKIHQ